MPLRSVTTIVPSIPDTVPASLEPGVLLLDAVDDGTFMERANAAWLSVMREAIRTGGKASITMKVSIAPDKARDESPTADDPAVAEQPPFSVKTQIKVTLPDKKAEAIFIPAPEGVIRTDLRTIRKVLRPADGAFVDQRGERCDEEGRPLGA